MWFCVCVSDIVTPAAKENTSDFFFVKNGSLKKIKKSDFFSFLF